MADFDFTSTNPIVRTWWEVHCTWDHCNYKATYRTEKGFRKRFSGPCPRCGETALQAYAHEDRRTTYEQEFDRDAAWERQLERMQAEARERYERIKAEAEKLKPKMQGTADFDAWWKDVQEILARNNPGPAKLGKTEFYAHAAATHPDLGGSVEEFRKAVH